MTLGDAFDETLACAVRGEAWAWCSLFGEYVEDLTRYTKAYGAIQAESIVADAFSQAALEAHRFRGNEAQFRAWLLALARVNVRSLWRDSGAPLPPEPRADDAVTSTSWLVDEAFPQMSDDAMEETIALLRQLAVVPFHPAFPAVPVARAQGQQTKVHADAIVTFTTGLIPLEGYGAERAS